MLGEVRPLMGLLFPVLVVNSCFLGSEYLSIVIYLAEWMLSHVAELCLLSALQAYLCRLKH